MELRTLLLGLVLASPLAVGCGEEHSCTFEERGYVVEMKRPLLVADGPLDTFTVEACVDDRCTTGTSDASGTLSFSRREDSATDGKIDRTGQTIRVMFQLSEHSAETTAFVLRVKRGDTRLIEEQATLEWTDDGCHSAPVKTSL